MKRLYAIYIVFAILCFTACNGHGDNAALPGKKGDDSLGGPAQPDARDETAKDSEMDADEPPSPAWLAPLVTRYIAKTDNELIKLNRQGHSKEKEGWLIDQLIPTDSAIYITLQIGHDEAAPDGSEKRYVTDGWLYIDTITKIIYEYDLPGDSLIRWKKQ